MARGLWPATFLGGFLAWVWVAISWSVLPWHCSIMHTFKDEGAVAKVLEENTEMSGLYSIPNMCTQEGVEGASELFEKGPVVYAAINKYGLNLDSPIPYVISLMIYFVAAFFITLLIMNMCRASYGRKFISCLLVGVAVGILGYLPAWNWWGFPFSFAVINLIDQIISWILGGIIIAAFVRPKKHKADAHRE